MMISQLAMKWMINSRSFLLSVQVEAKLVVLDAGDISLASQSLFGITLENCRLHQTIRGAYSLSLQLSNYDRYQFQSQEQDHGGAKGEGSEEQRDKKVYDVDATPRFQIIIIVKIS
jgi:hypothetical protein